MVTISNWLSEYYLIIRNWIQSVHQILINIAVEPRHEKICFLYYIMRTPKLQVSPPGRAV